MKDRITLGAYWSALNAALSFVEATAGSVGADAMTDPLANVWDPIFPADGWRTLGCLVSLPRTSSCVA